MRKRFDQLVLPAPELEEFQHLAHAIADARAVDAVKARVKTQELARRQLLVDERPIGNEPERHLRGLGLDRQIVLVYDDAS